MIPPDRPRVRKRRVRRCGERLPARQYDSEVEMDEPRLWFLASGSIGCVYGLGERAGAVGEQDPARLCQAEAATADVSRPMASRIASAFTAELEDVLLLPRCSWRSRGEIGT